MVNKISWAVICIGVIFLASALYFFYADILFHTYSGCGGFNKPEVIKECQTHMPTCDGINLTLKDSRPMDGGVEYLCIGSLIAH